MYVEVWNTFLTKVMHVWKNALLPQIVWLTKLVGKVLENTMIKELLDVAFKYYSWGYEQFFQICDFV